MKVHVQYSAQLRTALGRVAEDIELPDAATVRDLLVHLAAACGQGAASHLVTKVGELRPSLLVVVNGFATPARTAASTELRAGDVVALLPPISGG
jgi:MoaD family protein